MMVFEADQNAFQSSFLEEISQLQTVGEYSSLIIYELSVCLELIASFDSDFLQ